ncbi:FAD-dependent oxidoreductase [Legionella drozanskii]|uniref:3-(3-hydroxyphenyl)propionate hydroxylase n=1 Tax=Legionella drozanskii LLAP-1 TaxID=1212489 RepID=A0A0W0SR28_9GAMM|nr:hypothetical protein [Legionella drozanskii]KTC85808.1 3-(3-hydroxyphenyl)propionate hydroxylase [Legionella drozanskii LLAP-1]
MPIIIAGSGPVGLYTAILLAKKGYPVQVIDKYVDNFTRPGVVAIQAGETIARQLKRIGIDVEIPLAASSPETYYISDIQRVLYKKAKDLGVIFTKANFKSIKSNAVEVEGTTNLIPCDMLIDCTGENRQVVNYIISNKAPAPFTISKIATNPVKTNFIAFITLSNEDAELLRSYNSKANPVNTVLQFESLREQGWTMNDIPHWDIRRWEYSEKEKRFCCYFEMPDELARAPELPKKEWLATMLKLKTGKTIDFEIEGGSTLKFSSFYVDPHQVENPILEAGPYPFPVVACGDALMSAEYRKGTGIYNGIVCANGLVNATRFNEGKIQVNSQAFYTTMTDYVPTGNQIEAHIREVKQAYQSRLNKLSDIKIHKETLATFFAAHASSPEDETIKKGVFHQIGIFKKLADNLLVSKNYAKACLAYEEVLSACKILEENPSVDITELVKLYDLKARIYSNLERSYRGNNNLLKAEESLVESIQTCEKAITRIGNTEDVTLFKFKKELSDFRIKLEVRQESYTKHEKQQNPSQT